MRIAHRSVRDAIAGLLFVFVASGAAALPAGDRHPQDRRTFPEALMIEHGGRVIDVTRPPFNAKGNGKADDTAALVRAYDFVIGKVKENFATLEGKTAQTDQSVSYVIYLPDGEYLISDTIIYSGEPFIWKTWPHGLVGERLAMVRFVGESREGTTLRLSDRSEGFGIGTEKPVLSLGQLDFNNVPAYNTLRNLTIDTGHGNPGAVGVDWAGANQSSIRNLTIRSGDGEGACGLDIRIRPTMGYHRDLTVDGFDIGVRVRPYHVSPNAFEYVTLRGQRQAALEVIDGTVSVRKLITEDTPVAARVVGDGGHLVMLDSQLAGRGPSAIMVAGRGQAFARDVETSGFRTPIDINGQSPLSGGRIDEYLNGPATVARPGTHARTLGLPIAEYPAYPHELLEPSVWVNVDEFGASGADDVDDTEAIQAAIDTGAPVIYLPGLSYRISGPIRVPATLRAIEGVFGAVHGGKDQFSIDEAAEEPLWIRDLHVRSAMPMLNHAADRPVVLDQVNTTSFLYRNSLTDPQQGTPQVFLANVNGFGKTRFPLDNVHIWARFLNTEFKQGTNFTAGPGTRLWVLGYKVEGGVSNFGVRSGGAVEVLGGVPNQFGKWPEQNTLPVLEVERGGAMSYIGSTNGPGGRHFPTLVDIVVDGETKSLPITDQPVRPGRDHNWFIPLFVHTPSNETTR